MGPLLVFGIGRMKTRASNIFEKLIAPLVSSLGYEFVGLEYLPQGRRSLLRVYIDHPDGIGVEDCERVSHQVSALLDVEDPIHGQYNLEVSSPGLDRPLFTAEHFMRFAGNKVKVRIGVPREGQRNFVGLLKSVVGDSIVIVDDDKELSFSLGEIEKANLIPEF